MRKSITRTITESTINSASVQLVEGSLQTTANDPIIVSGVIDENKALKKVQKTYGVNSVLTSITKEDATYEISVEDFIKYATKVEAEEDE